MPLVIERWTCARPGSLGAPAGTRRQAAAIKTPPLAMTAAGRPAQLFAVAVAARTRARVNGPRRRFHDRRRSTGPRARVLLRVGVALVTAPRDRRGAAGADIAGGREGPRPREGRLDTVRAGEPRRTSKSLGRPSPGGRAPTGEGQADVRRTWARSLTQGWRDAARSRARRRRGRLRAHRQRVHRVSTIADRGIVLRLIGDISEALHLQHVVLACQPDEQRDASDHEHAEQHRHRRNSSRQLPASPSVRAFPDTGNRRETQVRLLGDVALTFGRQPEVALCLLLAEGSSGVRGEAGGEMEALTRSCTAPRR